MVKFYGHSDNHCFLLCLKYWQNKRCCGLEIFKWAVLGACFWIVLLKSLCHMHNRPRCPLQAACWAPTLAQLLGGAFVERLTAANIIFFSFLTACILLLECLLSSLKPRQNNLSDLEVLALMIATLSHDLDHRGVNNSYIQR